MARKNPTTLILIAMLIGVFVGSLLNLLNSSLINDYIVNGLFEVVGQVFIRLLSMLVVPLVFVSLVCGVASLKDINKLGRVGGKAMIYFLLTTAVAVFLAITLASIIGPGEHTALKTTTVQTFTPAEPPPLTQTIINMIPSNPIQAMAEAEGEMVPLIVFALFFGVALVMTGESGRQTEKQFNEYDTIIMNLVNIIMLFAPFGVFCLIAKTFAVQGLDVIKPLLGYFSVVVLALLVQLFVVYPLFIKLFTGQNIFTFIRKMFSVQIFAFSTASSNATIPVNIENAEKNLGVDNTIASFTIPLGATINMDGTAIMQGVATVFIANVYGIELGIYDFLMVIITATLASVGTAGVPGVGIIMLAMVLKQVGLPVEGIALIIGVDRLLDMTRTAVNVTGDAVATVLIAKSEGALNLDVYNAK